MTIRARIGLGNHRGLGCMGSCAVWTMDPEGLPEGAIGFVDFTTLTFYTEGGNEAIDQVITEDAVFGTFDPENIVEGTGLIGGVTSKPAIVGTALTQILAGATVVFDFTFVTGANGYFSLITYDSPDFNFTWGCGPASVEAGFDSYLSADLPTTIFTDLPLGAHRAAWTIQSTGVKISIDGEAVIADAGTAEDFALLNAAGMEVFDNCVLRSFAVYPPMNDAEMEVISAL